INSQTLFPGGAITLGGQLVTLPSPSLTAAATTAPVAQVGDSNISQDANGNIIIGNKTLSQGDIATIDGSQVSVGPNGQIIVNGASLPTTFATTTPIGNAVSSIIIGGQTLTAGGRVTVGGDILSLAPQGTGIVVIGTVTIGSGVAIATTTEDPKKKSAAPGKPASISPFTLLGLQFILFFIGGAF
ncbi:hypothetical protein BJ878DRAFT_416414, partial [Calycina marina]